jgi:hypothetical protein
MALTRSFRETVRARAQRDPDFRIALIREAVEKLIGGGAGSLVQTMLRGPQRTAGYDYQRKQDYEFHPSFDYVGIVMFQGP